MPYTKIQYIAYDVETLHIRAPGDYATARPLPSVEHMSNADAKARIQRMRDVAVQAASLGGLGGDDTLKIFVAPEFYFRQNRHSYRDISIVANIYSALMSAFQVATFNHWLIIPGTIFWSQDAPDIAHDDDAPAKKTAYFNTVMVIRGGTPPNAELTTEEKASKVPIVSNGTTNQKAIMSHIDFALGKEGTTAMKWDGAINPNFEPIISDWAWQKAHVFQVKGVQTGTRNVNFGLEVCLEHAQTYRDPKTGVERENVGALRSALESWHAHENEAAPSIDVQIVTSCGMSVSGHNVCARTGGYVILCDGNAENAPKKLHKVNTARAGTTDAVIGPAIAPTSSTPVTKALEVPGAGAQSIKVFPAQTL